MIEEVIKTPSKCKTDDFKVTDEKLTNSRQFKLKVLESIRINFQRKYKEQRKNSIFKKKLNSELLAANQKMTGRNAKLQNFPNNIPLCKLVSALNMSRCDTHHHVSSSSDGSANI